MDESLNNEINNILVLGGAGFMGSNLARFFVEQNKNVIVFDREGAAFDNINKISDKIKIYTGDFNEVDDLKKIFNDNEIDLVIHLISVVIPSTPYSESIKEMEINSTAGLINIMAEKRTKKIIYFSSGGVIYGKNEREINKESDPTCPINFYGQLKLSVENKIKEYTAQKDVDYIIVRPSNVYGTNQNIYGQQGIIPVTLGRLLTDHREIEVWGDGEIVRDFLHVDDLCLAINHLIYSEWNEVYNIGSGEGTSINKILGLIKKITEINFDITYKDSRGVDVPKNILNISKITNVTKWKKTINLEDGILKFWEEVKNKNYEDN